MILFIETGKSFEGPASGEQLAGPSFYLSGRRKYYEKFKKGSCDFRNSGSSAGSLYANVFCNDRQQSVQGFLGSSHSCAYSWISVLDDVQAAG